MKTLLSLLLVVTTCLVLQIAYAKDQKPTPEIELNKI